MRLPKITLSVAALVLANLVPLAGVLLFGWDAAVIVLLYWTENLVIGLYTILKIALAKVDKPVEHLGKLFAIPFFCVHFGGFCAVHGFFLLVFFKVGGQIESLLPHGTWLGPLVFIQLLISVVVRLWHSRPPGMEWPVLGLFVSHGISFVQNYLVGREYASMTGQSLMMQPYGRIVLLHVAIIAGGMPVMLLGSPVPLLCILIVLKIGMDMWLHARSHQAARAGTGRQLTLWQRIEAARRASRADEEAR